MILSIDCGTSNFAYSVINNENNEIVDKLLLNIKQRIGTKNKCKIEAYTVSINKIMDAILQKHLIEEVLIEKQMINNSKCSIIMSSIMQYCIFNEIKYVIVKPNLKGNISIGKYFIKKTKKNHTNNKNASKFDVIKLIGYNMKEYKKKDDLCDTYTQYLGYKHSTKQIKLCDCDCDISQNINDIITNENDIKTKQKLIISSFSKLPTCCRIKHITTFKPITNSIY